MPYAIMTYVSMPNFVMTWRHDIWHHEIWHHEIQHDDIWRHEIWSHEIWGYNIWHHEIWRHEIWRWPSKFRLPQRIMTQGIRCGVRYVKMLVQNKLMKEWKNFWIVGPGLTTSGNYLINVQSQPLIQVCFIRIIWLKFGNNKNNIRAMLRPRSCWSILTTDMEYFINLPWA